MSGTIKNYKEKVTDAIYFVGSKARSFVSYVASSIASGAKTLKNGVFKIINSIKNTTINAARALVKLPQKIGATIDSIKNSTINFFTNILGFNNKATSNAVTLSPSSLAINEYNQAAPTTPIIEAVQAIAPPTTPTPDEVVPATPNETPASPKPQKNFKSGISRGFRGFRELTAFFSRTSPTNPSSTPSPVVNSPDSSFARKSSRKVRSPLPSFFSRTLPSNPSSTPSPVVNSPDSSFARKSSRKVWSPFSSKKR